MENLPASISVEDLENYLKAALSFADSINETVNSVISTGFDIEEKPDQSLVTTADKEAERVFRGLVSEQFPEMGVIGEEFPAHNEDSDFIWVVDPIDGTAEFARLMPTYGSIIALEYKGNPIVAVMDHPALNARFWAAKGQGAFINGKKISSTDCTNLKKARLAVAARENFTRTGDEGNLFEALTKDFPNCRVFHSCYSHACAVSGAVDVGVDWNVKYWDLAATKLLIEESGGTYELLRDQVVEDRGQVLCAVFGKPRAVEKVKETLKL